MSVAIEGREFWVEQLEKLNASGKTRSQYCRENSINYDRFGYWLKQLSRTTSEFVPVKLVSSEPTTPTAVLCTMELRGHLIKIHDLSALSFIIERLA